MDGSEWSNAIVQGSIASAGTAVIILRPGRLTELLLHAFTFVCIVHIMSEIRYAYTVSSDDVLS